ncbi:MAG: phosphate ABC transporter permease subunit PstC [Bacteroidota bacterium]
MNKAQSDRLAKIAFFVSGILAILILGGIFGMLLSNGLRAFRDISISEFLGSFIWQPSSYVKSSYGILTMVYSSLLLTFLALLIAVPIGIGCAAFLAEFCPPKLANILKPAIEILASVPSVTLGFLGLVLFGPFFARAFGTTHGLHAFNGAVLLAIMALPTIISISEDAIQAVPLAYKEGSYALGANKWETLTKVILPASASGIIASVMLGMGRVIGETMAVLMATGNSLAWPESIFSPVQPLTATIAIEMGEVPFDTPHYYSLFMLGVILFVITLLINFASDKLSSRFQIK